MEIMRPRSGFDLVHLRGSRLHSGVSKRSSIQTYISVAVNVLVVVELSRLHVGDEIGPTHSLFSRGPD
jgi:hypothetical protein